MKQLYILFFALFFQGFLFAQDSQLFYEGNFFNKNNKPQKNLIVTNKTSGNYDFTDEKGYLIIEAKAGDTLIFNQKDFRIVQQSDLKEIKSILDSKIKFKSVNPIFSKDYSVVFNKNSKVDSSDFNQLKVIAQKPDVYADRYRSIKKSDSVYIIKKYIPKYLFFSGSLQISNELGSQNVQPKLQNQFVQGRNSNGILQWNGPETSEMFSFGPDISTLGFNGNPYEYDINGSLVNRNNSISPSKIYDNSIIQKTQKTSTFLNINSYFEKEGRKKWNAGLDLGWVREDLPIKNQFQDTKNLGISFSKYIFDDYNLSINYKLNDQKATNTNRTGLFNRAYQNALLTPISFENSQGNLLSDRQRSYSSFADNPNYLLQNSRKYNFDFNQNIFNLKLAEESGDFRYFIEQSYENTQFSNFDQYKKFTVGFSNGFETERQQKNQNYNLNLGASYEFNINNFNDFNKLHFNAFLNNSDTKILYSDFQNYRYNRFSQDYILRYEFRFYDFIFEDFELEGEIGNGIYASNTVEKNDFFIPKASLNLDMKHLFDYNFGVKIFGTFYQNVSEPGFTKSYSNFNLTQINNEQLNTYFPIREAQSFKNLEYIDNVESSVGILIYPSYNYQLEVGLTNKKFKNDVFPVFENGQIVLKNLVDHTTKNYHLNLKTRNFPLRYGDLQIGFYKTISEVNNIVGNYQNVPISGFNSIYRGMVKGEALGVLMGTAYERNENGDVIIGNDGYPLVSSEKKILGNPIPDFTMKFSYTQNVKNFSLNVDVEWRKGGDIWNGTNANLDYYGRSENSAQQRMISNFVYDGVLQNGNANNIPVDFFNVNTPFEQNKFYRYGSLGVAEDYIVKGDAVRINNVTLSYNLREIKFLKPIKMAIFVKNILLWSKNNLDAQTSFFDFENGQGLNFYNLPSMRTFGGSISFIF